MDDRAQGATDLLTAFHHAGTAFRTYGYAQFLAHQSVRWKFLRAVGHAVEPFATVGVSFQLRDELNREVSLDIGLWARDGGFMVEGDASVDDPLPTRAGAETSARFATCRTYTPATWTRRSKPSSGSRRNSARTIPCSTISALPVQTAEHWSPPR